MEWEKRAKHADIVFYMEPPLNASGETLPKNSEIITIAGIARSYRFFEGLQKNYSIAEKIDCPDHFNIQKKTEQALKLGLPVVITEKNASRLPQSVLVNRNIFVCELGVNQLCHHRSDNQIHQSYVQKDNPA